jgi:hypothetical protein
MWTSALLVGAIFPVDPMCEMSNFYGPGALVKMHAYC